METAAVIPRGATFAGFLTSAFQIPSAEAIRILAAARPSYNLGHIRAGNPISVMRAPDGALQWVRYQIDANRQLMLRLENGAWSGAIEPIPYQTRIEAVSGTVHDSLFAAVENAGEQDQLALGLADIFGWDLDFYTDPRTGDTFRAVVEKRYFQGNFAGYGRILAAEYVNAGTPFEAIRFHDGDGLPAYFTRSGRPMKREFLRSPLKFAARISSGFSLHRFHPILKIYRPHLGVDFAAPIGTPVQTIGGGTVVAAGWHGESGREVKIRHADGYETLYLHLSRILVHVGEHVAQGQRIGLVGMSGLATGPHLDFRIEKFGRFENFEVLRRKLPPAAPVAKTAWADFAAARDRWLGTLEALTPGAHIVVAANSPGPVSGQPSGR